MKIGSHVGMSGKEMMLGSVKEALSYGAIYVIYRSAAEYAQKGRVRAARGRSVGADAGK